MVQKTESKLSCAKTVQGFALIQVVLEAKGETQLRNLSSKLEEAGVRHKLWMEQPENIPTCIAAAPYRKSIVQPYFKKFKLCGS